MTTFILARHGETEWSLENRYAGSSDIPLTPRGHDQAGVLANWAIDAHIDAVFSSTQVRAVRTAIPAARACHVELRQDADFREVDFGDGEGLTRVEMAERFPEAHAAFIAAPASNPLPGGERGVDAVARAISALDRIREEFPDGRVLVVTHSTLMRLTIATLIGMDPDRYRSVFSRVDHIALTTLKLFGPEPSVSAPHGEGAQLLGFNVPPNPFPTRG